MEIQSKFFCGCPKCESSLTFIRFKSVCFQHCSRCRGYFLDFEAMEHPEITEFSSGHSFAEPDPSIDHKDIDCPKCQMRMNKEERKGIQLDVCPFCEGVWFDESELFRFANTKKGKLEILLKCPECEKTIDYERARKQREKKFFCRKCHVKLTFSSFQHTPLPPEVTTELKGFLFLFLAIVVLFFSLLPLLGLTHAVLIAGVFGIGAICFWLPFMHH